MRRRQPRTVQLRWRRLDRPLPLASGAYFDAVLPIASPPVTAAPVRRRRTIKMPTMAWLWSALAIVLPFSAGLMVQLSAVDLAYAIRAGQDTISAGAPVRTDTYTFTAQGTAWTNQQWLAQVALALGYELAGWPGLALLRAALVGLIAASVFASLRASGLDKRTATLASLGSFLVAVPSLALRAQLLGATLFALSVWMLSLPPDRSMRRWALVPVAAIWANVHGSFILAPALSMVFWLVESATRARRDWTLLAIAVASAISTFANPFGWDVWLYAAGLATDPRVTELAAEWRPTTPSTVPGLVYWLAVLGVAILFLTRVRGKPGFAPRLVVLIALAGLGAYVERGVLWWAVLAPVLALPPALADGASVPHPPLAERRNALHLAIPLAVVLVAALAFPGWRYLASGDARDILDDAPVGLTQPARNLQSGARVFVYQPWASWFEFAAPAQLVFVDSRIELFSPEVWGDYLTIIGGSIDSPDILERWGVTAVAIDVESAPELRAVLWDEGWRAIATVGAGELLVAP